MIKICEYCKHKFNARRSSVIYCCVKCKNKARIIDLKNQKFGSWTVLNKDPKPSNKGNFWMCRCVCGNEKFVCGNDLRKGISKSCGCANKLPSGESECRWIYSIYKKQSISRGHKFDLTLDQFKIITKQDCFYCGSKPSNKCNAKHRRTNGNYIYNGIDRVNNKKGYSKENVVPCCKICNSMKGKLSPQEFFDHIDEIIEFSRR